MNQRRFAFSLLLMVLLSVPACLAQAKPPRQQLNDSLIAAIKERDTCRVLRLLEQRADADTRDANGTTALQCAVLARSETAVRALLKKYVNIQAKNKQGETALLIAKEEADEWGLHCYYEPEARRKADAIRKKYERLIALLKQAGAKE